MKYFDAIEQQGVLGSAALCSARSGYRRIGIDMQGVCEIDFGGLRALLRIAGDVRRHGASVVVLNLSASVRESLAVTGLVKVLPAADAHFAPSEVFAWNLR